MFSLAFLLLSILYEFLRIELVDQIYWKGQMSSNLVFHHLRQFHLCWPNIFQKYISKSKFFPLIQTCIYLWCLWACVLCIYMYMYMYMWIVSFVTFNNACKSYLKNIMYTKNFTHLRGKKNLLTISVIKETYYFIINIHCSFVYNADYKVSVTFAVIAYVNTSNDTYGMKNQLISWDMVNIDN